MPTGTVKEFNDLRGYGWITVDGTGESVFVHQTTLQFDGFRTASPGDRVQFEIVRGGKTVQAQNVRRIG